MFSFMIAVLGSFVFWGVYFLISLIAGTIALKAIAPRTWEFVSTGSRNKYRLLLVEVIVVIFIIYAFWPFVMLAFGIYYLTIFAGQHLFWTPFRFVVNLIDKNIPTISIKKD